MLLKYFYNDKLAQASYLVGCSATGNAIVIDPARDITPYIAAAQRENLQISIVTETHIHADYISGTRELATATGAEIAISNMGGDDWSYNLLEANLKLLNDGDHFMVGNVRFEVLHTPGHTPEHIAFQITDTATADEPIGIFTGDFLFVGDVGRPDLLEQAVGIVDSAKAGARQQYATIQRFKALPDYLQIWPGHGAGSACGKALGAIPSTTLGYEKRFNPAFQYDDETAFVDWLLADQPEVPTYFAHMKEVNQQGPELLRDIPQAQHIREHPGSVVPEGALFIDTRPENDFSQRHIPGSISIPLTSGGFTTYLGWYVDYEQPTFFIAYKNDVIEVLNHLFSIGVDNVPGYFTAEVVKDSHAVGIVKYLSPREIDNENMLILDVRGQDEYDSVHIPGALHIPMGFVPNRLQEIPKDKPVAVHCETGIRSQVVVSLLQREGYSYVFNMSGGIERWQADGLPIEADSKDAE